MSLKIDAKFEGKLICAFKNELMNLATLHKLKNSDFIKIRSNQINLQLGAVRKLCFTEETNRGNSPIT